MAENDPELLNAVYKEISEKLGMDTAMEIYRMFKGQQISFPMRFFNPARIQKCILQEYDGTNLKTLAIKYGYAVIVPQKYCVGNVLLPVAAINIAATGCVEINIAANTPPVQLAES